MKALKMISTQIKHQIEFPIYSYESIENDINLDKTTN